MNTNNVSVSSLNNNSQTLYFGFSLLKSYQLDGKFFKLNHVGYNHKKRKLYCLDSMGILSVFTGKFALETSHLTREKSFPKYTNNYYKNLLFCEKYGIYLALNKNSRIEILNDHFQLRYVMPSKYNKKSILFIAYNSVTENVITQVRSGTVIWKLSLNTYKPHSPFSFEPFDDHKTLNGEYCNYMFLCEHLQRLYLCTKGTIFVYLCKSFSFLNSWSAHDKTITCMEYSPYANVIASASEDLSIKIWSIKGFHIFTFKGHSRPVISFTIHPRYNQLIFSGSEDGIIKVWSLESYHLFYSMNTLMDAGIVWMGAAHSGWIWCGSRNEVHLYAFNICGGGLWGCVGCDVDRLLLAKSSDKTRQIVAVTKDSSARIYCATSTGIQQRAVSTLLPIPLAADAGSGVFCITYSRINNLFYVLVNPVTIWIYTSKTDPSSRIGEWDVKELQNLGYVESSWKERNSLPHRATVCNKDEIVSTATCLTTAHSSRGFQFAHFSGTCSALCRDFLLIGLSNGKVLFADQKLKNRIHLSLEAHNRTIMDVKMADKLITLSDPALVVFQIWSVPELFLLKSVQVGASLTAYDLFGNYLACGFSDGAIMLTYLDFQTKGKLQVITSSGRLMMRRADENLAYNDKHDGKILSISSCLEKSVFASTSVDQSIKIWNLQRSLVTEIHLDETLTSCLFLDDGDMLIGWKNHIFKILYNKWLPPNNDGMTQVQSVSSASTNIFHLYPDTEESSIYGDENDLVVHRTPTREDVTLESYLKPYQLSVKENNLHIKILKGNKNKSGRDEVEEMYKNYTFKTPVRSHHMRNRHAISSNGDNDGDKKDSIEDTTIAAEEKPPKKMEPKNNKDVEKPTRTLIDKLNNCVGSLDESVKKLPRSSENGESHKNLRQYFGIFPVISNQPPFGGQSRAFGEIMLGKILDKKNTPQNDDVISEKGVEIPINGGGGDQLKLIRGGAASSTGVGEALKKNRLMLSKVSKSAAFVTAKQRTRSPSKRITQSSIAFFEPTNTPAVVSTSQDSTPLKIEASRADIIDKNENVTDNNNNNSLDIGRPVSEIRMVYRNRNDSTPEKPKEDQVNSISDLKRPSKDEMIKVDDVFCEKGKIIEKDLSSSDLYAQYKKDGLQFDGDWQNRMVERHQLLQEQRRQRQELAASKRLYIESEKTVAAVNAHYRRASNNNNNTRPMTSICRSSTAAQTPIIDAPNNSTRTSAVSSRLSISRPAGADSCLKFRLNSLDNEEAYNSISTPVASFHSFAEHQMQLPPQRPPSSCSIPPKMSYVLVNVKKRCKPPQPTPTKMERELMSMRFPSRYQLLQRSLYLNSKSADQQSNNSKVARSQRPNTSVNLSQRNLNTSNTMRQHRAKSAGISINGSFNSPLISVLHRKKQFYKPTKFGSYQ